MFAQNLFFYTASIAVIVIMVIVLFILIIWLVILGRFARTTKKIEITVDSLREKIKISSLIALLTQGIKEIISFIKEQRKGKEEEK